MSDPRVEQKKQESLVKTMKEVFDQKTQDAAQNIQITSQNSEIAALQAAVAALQASRTGDRAVIDSNTARIAALEAAP